MDKSILLAALIVAAVFFGCFSSEFRIRQEIEKANYCSTDSDCTIVFFGCPFGCGSYANKNSDIGNLKNIVSDYQGVDMPCEDECISPPLPSCRGGKCVGKICEPNRQYDSNLFGIIEGVTYFPCQCPKGTAEILDEKGLHCLQGSNGGGGRA